MSDVGHATGQSVGTFRDPGFSISLVAYPHVVQPLQPICKLLVQPLHHPLCRSEGQGGVTSEQAARVLFENTGF